MLKGLLQIWRRFFPLSERQAIKIAMVTCRKVSKPDDRSFRIWNELLKIYIQPKEPCWYVSAPWGDGLEGTVLRSSRVIAVSKVTGAVL